MLKRFSTLRCLHLKCDCCKKESSDPDKDYKVWGKLKYRAGGILCILDLCFSCTRGFVGQIKDA